MDNCLETINGADIAKTCLCIEQLRTGRIHSRTSSCYGWAAYGQCILGSWCACVFSRVFHVLSDQCSFLLQRLTVLDSRLWYYDMILDTDYDNYDPMICANLLTQSCLEYSITCERRGGSVWGIWGCTYGTMVFGIPREVSRILPNTRRYKIMPVFCTALYRCRPYDVDRAAILVRFSV